MKKKIKQTQSDKEYQSALQRAEDKFFQRRKDAVDNAANAIANLLISKKPVPNDFPYIQNFMAWIGRADDYNSELPINRETVKLPNGEEYAVGIEMLDAHEYPPEVREAAILSFWLGAEIMRLEKSDPEFNAKLDAIGKGMAAIQKGITPRALAKSAEQGFDNAMWKRDHKTRPAKGPEPRYDSVDIKSAVAEIKKRVKDGKGELTLTKAVSDVRAERRLCKIKPSYLYRECYKRKSAKTAHK